MVKSHVKVWVRTRPSAQPFDGLKVQADGKSVAINFPKTSEGGQVHNQLEGLAFKFDGVLDGASQEDVYASCANEVVDSVLAGYNGTMFCYGQTGAGKTYTMSGEAQQYSRRGIIARAIHQIFQEIDARVDRQYTVKVSYLEIYNEVLYDLLADNPALSGELHVLEENHTTFVKGLAVKEVRSQEEALSMFFQGDAVRSISAHALNASSTRSHCIFTLHLEMRPSGESSERAVHAKLNLVDLAGSERTKKTGVTGQALKEANFINKSLTFLEQTVNALSRKEGHVPFRQTKLTSVLRDALGGNCKTVMVANVWGEAAHLEETVSTLRFASRVKLIETDAFVTESNDPSLLVRRYERQIKELKAELAMRDTLSGRGHISYGDLSDAELRELALLVKRFLSGEADVDELPADTLKRVKETFGQMQLAYQALRSELQQELAKEAAQRAAGTASAQDTASGMGPSPADQATVGDDDLERSTGFHVGQAPAGARPMTGTRENDAGPPGTAHSASRPRTPATAGSARPPTSIIDKNAAFLRFKRAIAEGQELNEEVKERQAQLKQARQALKGATFAVNAAKRDIDSLADAVEAKKGAQGTGDSGDVIDDEECQLIQSLKAVKLAYRREFDQVKELRTTLDGCIQSAADAQQALLEAFNGWYAANGGSTTAGMAITEGGADELDPGEEFDRMEMERIMATDPESASFVAAKKQIRRKQHGRR
ncbi:hypothetical protein WJX72_007966 [[Myrmecia] bisecta]|uniref:Kinesin-like protein n=1 Tax=[Myrmecia] bisecta TaxID=41462 RepID=A0AAW1PD82_9CHLO